MKLVEHAGAARRPTIIDRIVTAISPRAGFERHKARMALTATGGYGGYAGGRRDRRALRNWRPAESSADRDTLPDLPDLRARARDLARNSPIATGAIATAVTNVIGDGLQLQASVDGNLLGITDEQADQWELTAEREWALFCKSADFTGVQPFEELQALAFRAVLESGDVFLVRRYRKDPGDIYGTKVQLLEADRISNPNRAADTDTIAGGVEVDAHGRPIAYHVTDKHPGALRVGALKWDRLPARTPNGEQVVIHLFDRLRPEQTRGVPYLAPVIEHLAQLGKYTEAEIAGAVMNAMIVAFTKTNADQTVTPILGENTDAQTGDSLNLDPNEVQLGSAAQIHLRPGEDVSFPNPARPNPNFDPFVMAFLRQIGVALELPFELLIKHFTASYSASRAALEMAWQFFRKRRTFVARRLCQVVYGWVMAEAVATGRLQAPGYFDEPLIADAYCGAEWIGPARASLNPKMEAEADEVDMRNGVKTGEQVCLERTGGEIEKKLAQLGKEKTLKDAAGLAPPAPNGGGQPQTESDANAADADAEDETQPQRGRA